MFLTSEVPLYSGVCSSGRSLWQAHPPPRTTVQAGLCCGSRLRKGEVFAYVGRIHNLKDLKDRGTLLIRKHPPLDPTEGLCRGS